MTPETQFSPARLPLSALARRWVALFGATLLAAFALACGGRVSTDTGNPPVIDESLIQLEPSANGTRVVGSAGAVSPAGATVRVVNTSAGDSVETTAGMDGSFDATVPSSPGDDIAVEAESEGGTTTRPIPPTPVAAGLDGRRFLLVSSDGYTPVADTTPQLGFDDGNISYSGGCNSHFGEYSVCGESLCVDGLGSTQIGCTLDLQAQDEWFSDFLTSRPTFDLDGDDLVLTGDGVTLTFQDREVADPDLPLIGRVWTVDTIIQGDAAGSFPPSGPPPSLEFGEDSIVNVFTGCNQGGGSYEATETEIVFGDIVVTEEGCGGAVGELENHMLQIVAPGSVSFEIDAKRLTITRGDIGIMATAP